MEYNSDSVGKWMLICIAIGYGVALLAYGAQCTGEQCSQAWFGSGGIASLAGPLVALVAVYFAYKSYQANTAIGRASRYQKAAEMLSAPGEVSRAASIPVLAGLAREDKKHYYAAAIKTLIEFAAASDDEFKERLMPFVALMGERPPIVLPRSRMSGNEAVSAVGRMWTSDLAVDGVSDITDQGRLVLHNLYLAGALFVGDRFGSMDWRLTVLHQVEFIECNFSGSILRIAPQFGVKFVRCDFTGCTIHLFDIDGDPLELISSRHLSISGGSLSGGRVGNHALPDWIAASEASGSMPA